MNLMKQTGESSSRPQNESHCVVCQQTSQDTPFNCRYRVHNRNEEVLANFFNRPLVSGQLCDRCYRYVWHLFRFILIFFSRCLYPRCVSLLHCSISLTFDESFEPVTLPMVSFSPFHLNTSSFPNAPNSVISFNRFLSSQRIAHCFVLHSYVASLRASYRMVLVVVIIDTFENLCHYLHRSLPIHVHTLYPLFDRLGIRSFRSFQPLLHPSPHCHPRCHSSSLESLVSSRMAIFRFFSPIFWTVWMIRPFRMYIHDLCAANRFLNVFSVARHVSHRRLTCAYLNPFSFDLHLTVVRRSLFLRYSLQIIILENTFMVYILLCPIFVPRMMCPPFMFTSPDSMPFVSDLVLFKFRSDSNPILFKSHFQTTFPFKSYFKYLSILSLVHWMSFVHPVSHVQHAFNRHGFSHQHVHSPSLDVSPFIPRNV